MMSIGIPRSRTVQAPSVVQAVIGADERYSLGVDAEGGLQSAASTRTQDPGNFMGKGPNAETISLGDATECSIIESGTIIGTCVGKVCTAVNECVAKGTLSQAAADAIIVGTRRWAASTMADLMKPHGNKNSPGLRCAFYAMTQGVLSVLAPPVRARLTDLDDLEECEDAAAASMMDYVRFIFQSSPFILHNLFLCQMTAFEPGLGIRNHGALQGYPGAGKSKMIQQLILLCLPAEQYGPNDLLTIVNELGGSGWSSQMFNMSGNRLSFAIVFVEEMDGEHVRKNLTTLKKVCSSEKSSRWSAHMNSNGDGSVKEHHGRFRFTMVIATNDRLAEIMTDALGERFPVIHTPLKDGVDGTDTHIARQDVLEDTPEVKCYMNRVISNAHYTQGFFVMLYQLQLAGAVPKANITIPTIILNSVSSILKASGERTLKSRARQYITRLAIIHAANRLLVVNWMRPGSPYEGKAVEPQRVAEVAMAQGIVPNVVDLVRAVGFYLTIVNSVASDEICAGILRYVLTQIKSCINVASDASEYMVPSAIAVEEDTTPEVEPVSDEVLANVNLEDAAATVAAEAAAAAAEEEEEEEEKPKPLAKHHLHHRHRH